MGAVMKAHALGLHLLDAPLDVDLLHLEVGDAVAEQAARLLVLLVDMHLVAGARELLRAGKSRRAGAYDRHALAGLVGRRLRLDPAVLEALVDDRALDRLDGDRVVVDVKHARRLARRRAHAAGKFRKIIGRVQVLERLFPIALVDQVVPVRDLVVHRAAGVTIGDAAIHAARGLLARLRLRERQRELAIVAHALFDRFVFPVVAIEFEEARYFAHRLRPRPRAAVSDLPPPSIPPAPGGTRAASPCGTWVETRPSAP